MPSRAEANEESWPRFPRKIVEKMLGIDFLSLWSTYLQKKLWEEKKQHLEEVNQLSTKRIDGL